MNGWYGGENDFNKFKTFKIPLPMNPIAYSPEDGNMQEDILKGLANYHICHCRNSYSAHRCFMHIIGHFFFTFQTCGNALHVGSKGKEVDKYFWKSFVCGLVSV